MGGDRRIGVFWAWGRGGGRRIGVSAYSGWIGVSAYSGPGGSGGDQRIGVSVFWVWGRWGGGLAYWRSTLSAYRRILGLGVGGGRGLAYRRIGVLSFSGRPAAHRILGLGGGGGGNRRIGVLSFLGQRGGHRRIGVFWAWGSGGLGGGSAYRRMGVFWAWGVGGGWIGVSACWTAHRRIGVFWAWKGGQGRDRRTGVSAYSGPEGSVGGGGATGATAYRRRLVFCPSLHARCFVRRPPAPRIIRKEFQSGIFFRGERLPENGAETARGKLPTLSNTFLVSGLRRELKEQLKSGW